MKIGAEGSRFEPLPVAPVAGNHGAPAGSGGASFASALGRLGRAVDRGEALIAQATHGGVAGLDSGQLIALQAGIYHYSEAVDLVAKLVDRGTSAIRTVISPH